VALLFPRKRKRQGTPEDLSAVDLELSHTAPDEESAERLAALQKAVQGLPAEQREAILLALLAEEPITTPKAQLENHAQNCTAGAAEMSEMRSIWKTLEVWQEQTFPAFANFSTRFIGRCNVCALARAEYLFTMNAAGWQDCNRRRFVLGNALMEQ